MSSLMNLIMQSLSPDKVSQLSNQIGEEPAATKSAIEQALPLLIGSLANNNTSNLSGWNLLSSFIDQNKDGSIMDDLLGFALGKGTTGNIDAIQSNSDALSQILGSKQSAVEESLGNSTGLSMSSIAKLLPLLAPIVIGALAKMQKANNLDQEGVKTLLNVEKETIANKNPEAQSFFESILDQNNDGSVMDDLAKVGSKLMSNFLRK